MLSKRIHGRLQKAIHAKRREQTLMEKETPQVTAIACGPSTGKCKCQCPDGPCEHVWDGPEIELMDGQCVTVTCSRCGMSAYSHSMWVGP